ncbi:aminotransferase [Pikeienuella sp. HZG-20]|uniref:aminotransferase n=1 Tax=Paludibacillus litoralis TaxID=3133267 RepID=UPI0030EBF273
MDGPLSNAQTRDVEALLHPYTNAVEHRKSGPLIIETGKGVYVYDDAGKRYIEGMAGLWCAGLGFGDAELIEAAKEQLDKLPYYHLFSGRSFEAAIELAEKIKEIAPVPISKVIYQSSGSEANDSQIKLVWYYNNARGKPDKKKIISRKRGYHGVTIVSGSLTGLPANHTKFDLPVDRILHTGTPHFWREGRDGETEAEFTARLARELEEMILQEGPDTVAAFIAEPVMGAGGVIVPPEGYFPAIQEVLQRYDVLCIDDEVICGFGRTGNWFGADTFNMKPTSISMAKQLTAAYAPLSAVAINQDMADAIEAQSGEIGTFGHGFTYGGHPLGCALGVKAIEIYQKRDIVGHVQRLAPGFAAKLNKLAEHPLVGEARSAGLMGALELSPDKASKAVFGTPGKVGGYLANELFKQGVILRPAGDTLVFCPPMVITEDEVEALFAPIESALDATHAWAKAEGHLG